MTSRVVAALLLCLASCNKHADQPAGKAPKSAHTAPTPGKPTKMLPPTDTDPEPEPEEEDDGSAADPDDPAQKAVAKAPVPTPAQGSATAAPDEPGKPAIGSVDPTQGTAAKPVIHGDKWKDDDEEGSQGFTAFKETWIYVDGVPKGAMLFSELPATLPIAWKDDVIGLDFGPDDPPPHEKKVQLLRWRLADYFSMLGIDLKKITYVYLHGNGYVAISGDTFRKFAKDITFDLTGNDLTKSRFYWPKAMKTNAQFDRYAAVSVFIDRPPLDVDIHHTASINGQFVAGIPYHGTPERGGFRVYVDYKLAMTVKRNELGSVGRIDNEHWDLMKLLESRGVKAKPVAADLILSKAQVTQTRTRVDAAYVKHLSLGINSQASGTLLVGKDAKPATALHLYTQGHVPPVLPMPEFQRAPPGEKPDLRPVNKPTRAALR